MAKDKYKSYGVTTADSKGSARTLRLSDGKSASVLLRTHRFALVGRGDDVEIDVDRPKRAFVSSKEDSHDRIQFSPAFETSETVRLGNHPVQIKVREIVSDNELAAYDFLERFHYKTSALNEEEAPRTDVGGRRAVLVAFARVGGIWHPAGYIELQMPLLMVKPRHDLFNKGFQHTDRTIKWVRWDQHAIKRYVNLIVRVARVVTAPDLRGISLARVLLTAAKKFSRERWHIGGRRPIFMEISAEMLNHVDFVSSAGFRLVGSTEGNADRVLKDLHYMRRGYDVSSGIMSLQKSYVTKLRKLCERTGKNFDDVLHLLRSVIEGKTYTNSLTASDWYILRSVIRAKIPYYLCALDESTEGFLQRSLPALAKSDSLLRSNEGFGGLDVQRLSVKSSYDLPKSDTVRTILEAFGLAGETIKQTILEPFSLSASPGNIIFVAGASGSGKSMMLRSLDSALELPHVAIAYDRRDLPAGGAAWLQPINSDRPLIEYFADKWGPDQAMSALNLAGLSEAFVYVKLG